MSEPEDQIPPTPHAELPSYELHDDGEPVGWRRWIRGWRLVLLLLLVGGIVAAVFGARPLYDELKARRALALADQAGEALDRGQVGEASTLLRQAALMAFDDPRVAARVTLHAARSGDMASVAEIGNRLREGHANTEEILIFGERSLGAGQLEDARRALAGLPAGLSGRDDVRRTALEAGLLQAEGRTGEAQALLRDAIGRMVGPDADALRVMLANILLTTEDPVHREEADTLLEQASLSSGDDGVAALRLLALMRAGLSPGAQQALNATVERLQAHPASSAADEIFIARLVVGSDRTRADEAVDTLVRRLRERNATIEERVAAARWLVGLGAHEGVLALIDEEEPSTHAGALMVRIDALSELGRWEECRTVIEANRGGTVPDTIYHLLSARIAQEAGDNEAADRERRLLRQVMQFAELPHVLFAARYAEVCGWKPEAFAAWRILATDSGARPEALRGQLRNLPASTSTAEAVALAEQILALQPDDPSARLSAAYFRLLASREVDSSAALAEEFLAADPSSVDVRRVAALARLRTGQATAGLDILPDDEDDPRWRALNAALLHAAGRAREAQEITRTLDERELTPADRELLRGL